MVSSGGGGGRLATVAHTCGALAFLLWLLSFAWVPFALAGREIGSVWYIIVAGEAGALLAALLAIGLGVAGRRRAPTGTSMYRRATRGVLFGAAALVLIIGLNLVGLALS